MKVGTDGVLLGAWADVKSTSLQANRSTSILDVGTGTGLIALMAAQRNPEAHIIAIDVNPDAVLQAQENVGASPFANRVIVRQADFRKGFEGLFDAILCNPPYFENALRCPDASRSTARHSDTLRLPTSKIRNAVPNYCRLLKSAIMSPPMPHATCGKPYRCIGSSTLAPSPNSTAGIP